MFVNIRSWCLSDTFTEKWEASKPSDEFFRTGWITVLFFQILSLGIALVTNNFSKSKGFFGDTSYFNLPFPRPEGHYIYLTSSQVDIL